MISTSYAVSASSGWVFVVLGLDIDIPLGAFCVFYCMGSFDFRITRGSLTLTRALL